VHLAVLPHVLAVIHFVDAREDHGVLLGLLVGADEQDVAVEAAPFPALRPRHGIVRKDPVSVVLDFDESAERMLGWSREEVIGQRSLELTHPDDHERAIANYLDMINSPGGAKRVRLRQRRGDGEWVWVEITNHNLLNERGYILGEMVDVSEEMAAMEALRADEELLRRLTQALPVGVAQLDRDGLVVYANDRVRAVLGVAADVGHKGVDLVAEATYVAALTAAQERGLDTDLELEVPVAEGLSRTVHVAVRALGTGGGAVVTFDDVTEEARLRDELQHRATYDDLTGCHTRRALMERLESLMRQDVQLTAFFVDLDGFKQVNDKHGHAVGDALLAHVGRCLLDGAPDSDLVGRLGGDEFLVVHRRAAEDGQDHDTAIAGRLASLIGTPLVVGAEAFLARASVGVARSTPGMDADALVASADALMYQVKTERRRSPCYAP